MKKWIKLLLILLIPVSFIVFSNVQTIYAEEQWVVEVEPTCYSPGLERLYTRTDAASTWMPTGDTRDIPKVDHDYIVSSRVEPTCIKEGVVIYECRFCHEEKSETLSALGHNYLVKTTKATCTEDGLSIYTCSRCKNSYEKVLEKLGHDYKETVLSEPTCTKEGEIEHKCKRCEDTYIEKTKALGHTLGEYVTVKEPNCIEDGLKQAECSVCHEFDKITLPALGHKYPEEWTLIKKASIFKEGLEEKTCEECGEVIEQVVPKEEVPVIAYIAGGLGLAAALFFGYTKIIKSKKLLKQAEEASNFEIPTLEEKVIAVFLDNEDEYNKSLIDYFKLKYYINIKRADYKDAESLQTIVEDEEPEFVIMTYADYKELEPDLDTKYAFIVDGKLEEDDLQELKKLKEDKVLIDYVFKGDNVNKALVKFVLPAYEPQFSKDNALSTISSVANLMGIPLISTLISAYTEGENIVTIVKEGEYDVSTLSSLIGSIASIMGFEKVETVTELVDDIDTIKSAIDKKKDVGVSDVKDSGEAIQDFVDVIKDVTDD